MARGPFATFEEIRAKEAARQAIVEAARATAKTANLSEFTRDQLEDVVRIALVSRIADRMALRGLSAEAALKEALERML